MGLFRGIVTTSSREFAACGTKWRCFDYPTAVQQTQVKKMLFWKSWIDAAQFCFEAQSVIAMRLMKIATGGLDGVAELTRMVLEKIDGGGAAHTAGALALAEGKGVEAATKLAMAPIKHRVRANHLRLLRG
jgi:hypothetical protein